MAGIIPPEYEGREQTFLKHRILREYLVAWGMKLGSRARYQPTTLRYVDCFAGPWRASGEELEDTSAAISLAALRDAIRFWATRHGLALTAEATFVEKTKRAFERLEEFARSRGGDDVRTFVRRGTFEQHAADIAGELGNAPAFIFVDPTGWKGVGMKHIATMARGPKRDVLVNVMFHHVNRFKDDRRRFLREQMRDFFGLTEGDLPSHLDEEELMSLYRDNLRIRCDLPYVADLAVPHPTRAQTFFRLVVGGGHPEVIRLFREVESHVCGDLAGVVREEAKRRKAREGGQMDLGLPTPALVDTSHQARHSAGIETARQSLMKLLEKGPRSFAALWSAVLQDCHVTQEDVAVILADLRDDGLVTYERAPRRRGPRDRDIVKREGG